MKIHLLLSLGCTLAFADDAVGNAASLVVDTNRFATADVAAELQKVIDANPNRTIYLPDGTYELKRAIKTPAHPKKSVTLRLAAFAVLKAAPGWTKGEPLVRLGATHPANDIMTVGSNYSFEGGVLDGSGVADGLSIDGGRETHVRDVSIKGTRIGLRIRHGANNGSSDADVDHVNIVCNSALDSIGVLVEGYDNSLSKLRIYGAHTGVRLVGGGNTLRDVHPLYRMAKEISAADYRTSVAFDDIGGGNVYDYCYSDQLATGFRIAANRRSQYDRCFALWYSPWGGRQVGFECLGRFESRVRDFRIDFHGASVAASNRVLVVAQPGGKGVFDPPVLSGPHVESLQITPADATPSPTWSVRAVPGGVQAAPRLWQGISPKVKAWELGGRAEALAWFATNQFGKTPGKPVEIRIESNAVAFPAAGLRIKVFCAKPKGADAEHPAPVFLFMDHRGGEKPPDYPQEEYPNIPTNAILARGYAYVRWNANDVCPNASRYSGTLHRWPVGIVSQLESGNAASTNVTRAADGWGTIGAWAWGNSRVLDWIAAQPGLDATRVAVVGHSRGGKTALWTAAQDERFAMAVSSGSGCGGARLGRFGDPKAEKIKDILRNFPNWFCPNFTKWIGRDTDLPHDADDLLKLIAPRLVYVASGSEDAWAGPQAEKAAVDSARDLYGAYGLPERIGYHCHSGPHELRPDDWEMVMDFADRNLKAPASADSDEIDRRLAAAVADGSRRVTLGRNGASPDGVWRIVRAIRVPDDFTLVLDGCRVELADRVQDNLIRNAGASETAPKPNRGIRILGRNGATLSGGERNHYRPKRSGDPNGWRSVGILLCDTSDYEIGGLAFGETQCWAISQERCHHGHVHDLVFGSTDRFYNQDGVDVRKGCHDLLIENISGSTGDDAVALTAYRDPVGAPPRFGMQIGGNATLGEADDVYNVTIRNVRAKSAGGHGVIRLLACDGIRMHHVAISNVVDTAAGTDRRPQATIRIGDVSFHRTRRCQMGEMHHIAVHGVKASGPIAVWVKGPLCDSSVTDITPAPGGKRYDITAPLERVELHPR